MFGYLCSCIPLSRDIIRGGINRIVEYLNSNTMNQQILEEEKCLDEYQERQSTNHLPKEKTYKKLEEQEYVQPDEEIEEPTNLTRQQRFSRLMKIQFGLMRKQLMVDPEEQEYERLYEGQEAYRLMVYYSQKLSSQSKRLSIFRFTYTLPIDMATYKQVFTVEALNEIDTNLIHYERVERLAEGIDVCYCRYKKVLVVTPREFCYLRQQHETDKQLLVVATSVEGNSSQDLPEVKDLKRGHIVLSGTAVNQVESGVMVQMYMEIDLDLNINPQMIKQPAVREIRKYVEKVVELTKAAENQEGQQQGPLLGSVEGI